MPDVPTNLNVPVVASKVSSLTTLALSLSVMVLLEVAKLYNLADSSSSMRLAPLTVLRADETIVIVPGVVTAVILPSSSLVTPLGVETVNTDG